MCASSYIYAIGMAIYRYQQISRIGLNLSCAAGQHCIYCPALPSLQLSSHILLPNIVVATFLSGGGPPLEVQVQYSSRGLVAQHPAAEGLKVKSKFSDSL